MRFSSKNSREEKRLRAAIEATLTSLVDIQRKSMISDGAGGTVDTWVTIGFNVPCAISKYKSGDKNMIGTQTLAVNVEFQASFMMGTDVKESDRVVYGGEIYEIIGLGKQITAEVPILADLVVVR